MTRTAMSLLAVSALACGCASTTTVDEFRPTTEPMEILEGEKVVVLGRRDAGHYETDRGFVECVGNEIDDSHFLVIPEQEFVDAVYPWFEPRTAPKGLERLKRLMGKPIVRDKVRSEKIRYMVWLDGEIETAGHSGSMSCALGPAGGGCFGLTMWDKTAFFEAIVWDLYNLTEEARIRVDSEGTSYIVGVVAPIPLLARVTGEACDGLGKQLRSYFSQQAG